MISNKVVEYLKSFIGRPYIWAGDGTGIKDSGFDCSGFVLEGLWAFGIYDGKDTTAQGLYDSLKGKWNDKLANSPNLLCLLFFGESVSKITHVAILCDDGLMLEAGGGGKSSKTENTSSGFVRIRPVSNRKDLVTKLWIPTP